MHYPAPLVLRTLFWAAMAAAAAIPLGLLIAPWVGWLLFVLVLVFQLHHHLAHLALLDRWSRDPQPDATLEGDGAWDEVFARIYRHEKELRSQIALRDQEIARFEAAGQALIDGVVLLDEHNQIRWCNATAEMQLGLVLRSDRSQHIANLVRQPEFIDYLRVADFTQPLTLRSDRKSDRVLSLHIIPYGGNQRLLQIRDITQSDRLDRMRRDFVANVSHELRTPLTVLSGFLETLQEMHLDPEERARFLALMAEQSHRMQNIVQDLLTLSSLEAAPPPDNQPIDMAMLVDRLQRDAQALSNGRHRIEVEIHGHGDLRGADNEIASALGNLVSNAVRYTPADGRIVLSWTVNADGACFAVRDSGIGIDPKHIPRLTERFYRVDRGRSRDSGGTGLGLAIVKHALNRHQARLEVTSTLGEGSTFAACFPKGRVIPV